MRRTLVFLLSILLVSACGDTGSGGGSDDDLNAVPADSVTQRQRDSVIGESGLPGAGGVRGALEASDAAGARSSAIDSLSASR